MNFEVFGKKKKKEELTDVTHVDETMERNGVQSFCSCLCVCVCVCVCLLPTPGICVCMSGCA